jgi:NADH dehydrogenase (ubiquinone) 1 alpha subcomplex subunit 2
MKKNNPNTPIMLREAAGTQPQVFARYGQSLSLLCISAKHTGVRMEFILTNGVEFGKEKSESLLGLSDKEIEDKVTGLVKTGI